MNTTGNGVCPPPLPPPTHTHTPVVPQGLFVQSVQVLHLDLFHLYLQRNHDLQEHQGYPKPKTR